MALKAPKTPKAAIPEVAWPEFTAGLHSDWGQGHHVTMLGRTRGGKTTTAIQLLDDRKYVFALLTKRKDDLFPLLKKHGYSMITDIADRPSIQSNPKVALHVQPEGLGRDNAKNQAEQIRRALDAVWTQGGWTLYLDEIASLSDLLNLGMELRSMWKEAASSKITLVAGTQRPARIPREAYSQARFLMFWRSNEREELRSMAGMNGVDPEPVRDVVSQLDRFEVLTVDTFSGELVRTRPPKLS
jgi:hypothetical protein